MTVALRTMIGAAGAVEAPSGNGPDGTQNYVAVTIQSSEVPSALSDFPVYVRLSDLPAAFWSSVQSDGGDIRVTEDDGTTRAPVELVSIDTGGSTGELHFKASSVSASSNTTYRVYYNATSTLSQPAVGDTYGRNAVWSDYGAVYHLSDDPSGTAPQIVDSTGNGNDGTSNGAMTSDDLVSGQVGDALDFDGSGDHISVPDDPTISPASATTLQAWVNTTESSGFFYISKRGDTGSDGAYWFDLSTGNYRFVLVDSSGIQRLEGASRASGAWEMLVGTYDGTNQTLYVNGSQSNTSSTLASGDINDSAAALVLAGRDSSSSFTLDGMLDEVRNALTTRSGDWISAEHTNQNAPTTFYSVGSEQSA